MKETPGCVLVVRLEDGRVVVAIQRDGGGTLAWAAVSPAVALKVARDLDEAGRGVGPVLSVSEWVATREPAA